MDPSNCCCRDLKRRRKHVAVNEKSRVTNFSSKIHSHQKTAGNTTKTSKKNKIAQLIGTNARRASSLTLHVFSLRFFFRVKESKIIFLLFLSVCPCRKRIAFDFV